MKHPLLEYSTRPNPRRNDTTGNQRIFYHKWHKKGKHLSYEDRMLIQIRLKDGYSLRAIARELTCSPTTISNEIKRGSTLLYNGTKRRYKASRGQKVYEENRKASCHHYSYLDKKAFIELVEKKFFSTGWFLDVCAGNALIAGDFTRNQVVCTKTLYNYVDMGLLNIRIHNLPMKLRRKTKKHLLRLNKRKLGRSIEERPKEIEERKEFGHWECNLVIGAKSGQDEALLTLLERKTREFMIVKLPDKSAKSVMAAFETLLDEYGEHFGGIFKIITTDNGSEFADLSNFEKAAETLYTMRIPTPRAIKAP